MKIRHFFAFKFGKMRISNCVEVQGMKAVLESEQQRLDPFCMVIESRLNGKTARDKPGLASSDYRIEMN